MDINIHWDSVEINTKGWVMFSASVREKRKLVKDP